MQTHCPTCGRPRPVEFSVFVESGREIRVNGETRRLGFVKWALLSFLRKHQDEWIASDRLFGVLYGLAPDAPKCKSSLRVHVHHVRKALKGTGFRITTAYGLGYMLERERLPEDVVKLQARLDRAVGETT